MAAWNPIPGETPIDDVSGLIPPGVTTRQELSLMEAENIRQAVLRYLAARPSKRQTPFTLAWIYKLHFQMFGKVWKWAGTKRTTELNLGIVPHQIDVQLQSLLDDLHYWAATPGMSLAEQAVRLHHRAVHIHPFLNGNGRWARMLANIWLRRHDGGIIRWPDQAVGETSVIRDEYLAAIRAADAGDLTLLIDLHERFAE